MNKYENFEPEIKNNLIDEDFQKLRHKSNSKKINKMLFSENNLSKYSWEVDGERVLATPKLDFA